MLFFIGETIGWQELLLIGIIALIFLGPRRLPQVAKTVGKAMAELRRAGQEFRKTWESEVALEEEEKNFLRNPLDENLILAEEKYSRIGVQKKLSDSEEFTSSGDIKSSSGVKKLAFQGNFMKEGEEKKLEGVGDLSENETKTLNGKQHWL